MIIKVTEERDCCDPMKDLKPYQGSGEQFSPMGARKQFCLHCGQLWQEEKYTDAAGSIDTRLVKRVRP